MATSARVLLRAFLEKHGITPARAGRDLRVSRQAILAWLRGPMSPTLMNRADIETWTKGEIAADAWPPLKMTARKRKSDPVVPFDAA